MSRSFLALVLNIAPVLGCVGTALAQTKPDPLHERTDSVKYESVAPGIQSALVFRTDELRDVTMEVKDLILGPGKSTPDVPVHGFGVTELKSGEVETTIDGQTVRRRPGDFWLLQPGQKYGLNNLGGVVVLHVVILTRK